MALEELKGDVTTSGYVDTGGKNAYCKEAKCNLHILTEDCNGEDELGEIDSGAESDETDLPESGDVGTELCLVGDQTCSVPLDLYDLPDLRDVLSLEVWNECLSEEDRLELAIYLPDMDKVTFMWTLKELLSGYDFHFGSPVRWLFEMMKSGMCEPQVALYRRGLNMLQQRKFFHQLKNHHNNMVSSMYQIKDEWIRCQGYNIDEKLQKLKLVRRQNTMIYEKTDDFGLDGASLGGDDPDGDTWSQTPMETRVRQKKASHLDYQAASGHMSRKQNPKALRKQEKPISPARQSAGYPSYGQYGSSSAFPKHDMKARCDVSPLLGERKEAECDAVMQRDKDGSIRYAPGILKLRKKHGYLGENESRRQNFKSFPPIFSDFIVNGESHQVNQLSDITVLATKPSGGGTSYDYGRKINYCGNIHAYTSDYKIGAKGKIRIPGSAVVGTPSGISDPSNLFWRSNRQPEAFMGDQLGRGKWDTHTRPQTRHGFVELDMNYEAAASLSNHRDDFSGEYRGGNCVQNGAPDMTALRGIQSTSPSDETESDSSKHINDLRNPSSNKESTYLSGGGSTSGDFGLENAKYSTKKKNFRKCDLVEGRYLDTQLVDTCSKKVKRTSDVVLTSHEYISLKATEDEGISDKGTRTSNKKDLKRKKHVLGRTRNFVGEIGEVSIVLKSYPLDSRLYAESEHDPSLNLSDSFNECGDNGLHSAEAEYLVGNQIGQQSSVKKQRSKAFASEEHANFYITSLGCSRAASRRKRRGNGICMEPEYERDLVSDPQQTPETKTGSHDLGTSNPPCSQVEITNFEPEAKAQKTRFTLITPTVHTGLPFSVIHLLSAVRVIMTTSQSEEPLVVSQPIEDRVQQIIDDVENKENNNHSGLQAHANVPSLTILEISNRMRSNPGDPCILETEEPLDDLVRRVVKIFSSKKAPLGAKDWKPLAAYRKSTGSWYWIGPILHSSLSYKEAIEEMTSPEAWGIPRRTLVKLVDSFANWLISSQEFRKQLRSLPAPPHSLSQLKLEEKDRFDDQRAQKSACTFEPSCAEARDYFRLEEALRYLNPDRALAYTAADGSKSMVAPLRRCFGKPTSKPREHLLLKPDRPPHVTILCLVRDAAARLPGCVGTRSDICTLMRDSQYIAEDFPDSQMNQIVSGALDRLHYEHDPCVRYETERKIWVYLHRERVEGDFEDDGTPPSRRFKRQKKDPGQPPDQDKTSAASDQDAEDQNELEKTDCNVEPPSIVDEENIIVDIM